MNSIKLNNFFKGFSNSEMHQSENSDYKNGKWKCCSMKN
jgi:hypothetical protein